VLIYNLWFYMFKRETPSNSSIVWANAGSRCWHLSSALDYTGEMPRSATTVYIAIEFYGIYSNNGYNHSDAIALDCCVGEEYLIMHRRIPDNASH
jgi:hypothetical protein